MPLCLLTNPFQRVDKRIVRLDCSLDRSVVGLFQPHRLQKRSSNVLHGLGCFEVDMIWIWCIDGMEDFGDGSLSSNDICCIFLLFCHLACEVESSADAFS